MVVVVVVVTAFSSHARTLEEGSTNHAPFPFFFSFFKVEIGSCAPIPFFTPGSVHKGSAS